MEEKRSSSPVILRVYDNAPEAYIALGALRSAGINCQLENQIISSVLALPTSEICEIKLLVNPADIDDANAILDHPKTDID